MAKIDLNEVRELHARLKEINSIDLTTCDFFENGSKIYVNPDLIKQFVYTGLNNKDFIITDFYKTGFEDEKITI
jgi:hypothetical protein